MEDFAGRMKLGWNFLKLGAGSVAKAPRASRNLLESLAKLQEMRELALTVNRN